MNSIASFLFIGFCQPGALPLNTPRLWARGDLIGRIEIPRLGLSTVIFEGTDGGVLRDGAGHLSGSALPGEKGNVVLAAHRDSFFQPLRYIQMRDAIDVVTPEGTRHYKVKSTAIVTPDRAEVMAPTRDSELTLITCYPFDWFGHAPKRFIVERAKCVIHRPRPRHSGQGRSTEGDRASCRDSRIAGRRSRAAGGYCSGARCRVRRAIATAPLSGNRVIRGLKKLNPKGLFAKLGGS